ncbi:MAG: hypothetical protein IIB09_02805 [Bacteroidetes bacterium]|nr:hypothetical protein [Bacteroidota bacterium]
MRSAASKRATNRSTAQTARSHRRFRSIMEFVKRQPMPSTSARSRIANRLRMASRPPSSDSNGSATYMLDIFSYCSSASVKRPSLSPNSLYRLCRLKPVSSRMSWRVTASKPRRQNKRMARSSTSARS